MDLKYFIDKDLSNQSIRRNLLDEIFVYFKLPLPHSRFSDLYYSAEITKGLLKKAYSKLSLNMNSDLFKIIENFRLVYPELNDIDLISIRTLSKYGSYPNKNIILNSSQYIINNGVPILINECRRSKHFSEVNNILKEEIRLLTSIMFCKHILNFNFVTNEFGYETFPRYIFSNFQKDYITDFICDYMKYFYFFSFNDSFYLRDKIPFMEDYKYDVIMEHDEEFIRKLFVKIDLNDDLLLRTCGYLIKAMMLWSFRNFTEEAIALTMFSIEGSLLLIQKKEGFAYNKIDLKKLNNIFQKNEKDNLSLNILEFIKEGYDNRTSIVHPYPIWGANWKPELSIEDFFEYCDTARLLINYYLTGEPIDWD